MAEKSIGISKKLHDFLLKKGTKNETFEEILWRLMNTNPTAERLVNDLKKEER